MDIQEQILDLVHLINTDQLDLLTELTSTIIYNTLYLCEKSKTYLSILYQLIFHTYKYNPVAACHILNGFIQFGYSAIGMHNKPMIDYFVIEAFTSLFKINGWAVVKPCVSVLRDSNPNYLNDSLFKHILTQIVKQINQDENDMYHSSNLCYNLPREKSFTWGWFSNDIAVAYFNNTNEIPTPKEMSKYMMLYRKLLTSLRKNTLVYVDFNSHMPAKENTFNKIKENWTDLLNALQHYTWASDIIKNTINDDDDIPTTEPTTEPTTTEPTTIEPTTTEPITIEPTTTEPTTTEPTTLPAPAPEPEPVKEKNTSWLSWFGLA